MTLGQNILKMRKKSGLSQEELGEKYLNLVSEKSKINKEYIQRWLPIVAAAYLDQENENKELLKKWSDIVDFT